MRRAYIRWLGLGLLLLALWVVVIRDKPMPQSWGNGDAIGSTPLGAALAFLPPDSEGAEQRSNFTLGSYAWVKIRRGMKADDSVRSIAYTVKLRRTKETWRVIDATYSQSCVRNLWLLRRSCT